MEANEKFSAPNNWIDWLIAIRDEGFVDPLRVATIGSEEWNTNGFLENESMVKSLRDELSRSFNSEISERISQALPYLVSWLKGMIISQTIVKITIPRYLGFIQFGVSKTQTDF